MRVDVPGRYYAHRVDLFDTAGLSAHGTPSHDQAPLAVRMRPGAIDELVGQDHLLTAKSALRRLLGEESAPGTRPASIVLWGPPGTGKTTIAYLIAKLSGRDFVELSAVTAKVSDVRSVIAAAKQRLQLNRAETIVFIDEVHRFSTTQQDSLLPAVENGWITLIAATTANPSFAINSPLLSRSLLLTLRELTPADIATVVERALVSPQGLAGRVELTTSAQQLLIRLAGPDARKALTILEAAAAGTTETITPEDISGAVDVALVRYDRAGDEHYDVASAFIKSMRGSDVDAALHYLARMIAAGEDPRFIARRIVIAAAEEVGMADPGALQTAVAAAQATQLIGMPEARIILSQAVIHVASAPKSNASYVAISEALADVHAGKGGAVPLHLRDSHYPGAKQLGHGRDYEYAHDAAYAVAAQEYAPKPLVGVRYYRPTGRGAEKAIAERLTKVRALLAGELD